MSLCYNPQLLYSRVFPECVAIVQWLRRYVVDYSPVTIQVRFLVATDFFVIDALLHTNLRKLPESFL